MMSFRRLLAVGGVLAAPLAAEQSTPDVPKHWGGPRFKGKRVLVTGGDSGIGFAAVQAFYLECAQVLLHGHSENKSAEAFASIKALPVPEACADSLPSIKYTVADIQNASEVASLIDASTRMLGGLDIAVNDAGIIGTRNDQIGDAGFLDAAGNLHDESVLDVNLRGTLKCMHAEIQYWLAAEIPGVMVNVGGIAGERAWAGPLLTTSKWAMVGFTKQAALRYARKGIRVNLIAPGTVNTTMLRKGRSPTDPSWIEERRAWERTIPAGRIAEPWEMAGPITFLASDMASYVNGAVLTVDGDLSQAPLAAEQPAPDVPKHWGGPRFKGKRVLVTGGDSGIGFAAVQAFYLECAQVLLHGHSENKSAEAFASIKALPVPEACADSRPSIKYTVADIKNASEVASLISAAMQMLGGMDIAVNNAGTGGGRSRQIGAPDFLDASGRLYDESILDVNLRGTLKCMHAEIQYWLEAKIQGVMVNVASIAGEVSWGGPLYTSSKWAMIGFTKQAALHYARKGIRVNALAPGAVNTTMLRDGLSPTDPAWIARRKIAEATIPAGRIAEPWEMAGPITFLASDMASYVNGAVLTADGDISQASPWGTRSSASGAALGDAAATRLFV